MLVTSNLLRRGVALWKNGEKNQAREIFKTIVYNDRNNESAWFWYIYTLESNLEKISALESFLNIFPENHKAKLALEELRKGAEKRIRPEAQASSVQSTAGAMGGVASAVHTYPARYAQSSRASARPQNLLTSRVGLTWFVVISGVLVLLYSFMALIENQKKLSAELLAEKQAHQILLNQYGQLNKDFQALSAEHDGLLKDFQALSAEHDGLLKDYNGLVGQYNSLNEQYTAIVNNFNALVNKYNLLNTDFSNLTGQYNYLNNVAVKPPYIVVHDRTVDTTFFDSDGQLIKWTTPFEGLEADIENGAIMRRLIVDLEWKTNLVYTVDDKKLWLRDFSSFISPDEFRNVIPELYMKSSTPQDFISRVWRMVGQLSNYASEDIETPRYPLETLLAGGGDCEDLSILFASMIKAAPVDWYVDILYVDSKNINNPQEPDHVVVFINTGDETFIVETTSDQVMLPYSAGVTGWLGKTLGSTMQVKHPEYFR